MLQSLECPPTPEEVAESYCLGRLADTEQKAFEDHYLICPRCAQLVEATQDFLDTFRLVTSRDTGIVEKIVQPYSV